MANKPTPGSTTDATLTASPSGRVLGPKLKIAAFILGVAAIEWVVAYFYLPSVAPRDQPHGRQTRRRSRARGRCPGRGRFGPPMCLRRACLATPVPPSRMAARTKVDWASSPSPPTSPFPVPRCLSRSTYMGSVTERQAEEFTKRMDDNKHRISRQHHRDRPQR